MTLDFPELLVLRHGETEWNREGRLQGDLDSALTPTGRAQARQQNSILKRLGAGGHDWIVSPKGRAQRTAEIAGRGLGVDPRSDDRLREIGMGDWTGRLRSDVAAEVPHLFATDSPPLALYGEVPGGETPEDVAQRVAGLLAGLRRPTVIVTHGITSRVLRCVALGLPVSDFATIGGGQGIVWRVAQGRQDLIAAD